LGIIAETRKEERKIGNGGGIRVGFFKDGKCDWYLDMTTVKKGYSRILELAKKNPKLSKDLMGKR